MTIHMNLTDDVTIIQNICVNGVYAWLPKVMELKQDKIYAHLL